MDQLSQSSNRHEQKRGKERSWIWLQEIPEQMLAHVEREEWHDVTTILGPYLEQHADNGDYWGYYGLALEKLGQDEEAVAAYHKAIEYGNNFVTETQRYGDRECMGWATRRSEISTPTAPVVIWRY